jgi:hypothetical protein
VEDAAAPFKNYSQIQASDFSVPGKLCPFSCSCSAGFSLRAKQRSEILDGKFGVMTTARKFLFG